MSRSTMAALVRPSVRSAPEGVPVPGPVPGTTCGVAVEVTTAAVDVCTAAEAGEGSESAEEEQSAGWLRDRAQNDFVAVVR